MIVWTKWSDDFQNWPDSQTDALNFEHAYFDFLLAVTLLEH